MTHPIPEAALDDRLGFIGTSGSGKTYAAGTAVERLLSDGARVVIVDPLGAWWGLRLQADGNANAFSLPIFGGDHGDLPLNEGAGKLIGETVAGMAESCIIDLSALPSKAAERRFMIAFLDAVYRKANGSPFHLVFDEADLWAPQKSSEPKLQSLMEQIVRRGRIKGFIPWVITQRPAVISKDILSQVDGLVAMKLTASQDRKAIGDWVKAQADEGQWQRIDASLPAMDRGHGVLWLPGRGILETVTFPAKRTFDSSRTPERGETKRAVGLKPLNLDGLKKQLAAIEDEAKANDPTVLRNEVARLKRELSKAEKRIAALPSVERVIANEADLAAAEARGVQEGIRQAQAALAALAGGKAPQSKAKVAPQPFERVEAEPIAVTASEGVTGPQQRILNALAWWKAFGHEAPSNEQVAFIAGYSANSTGYTNPRGALKSSGLVCYPMPGCVGLTSEGEAKATPPEATPTGEELRRRVMGKLSGPQQRIMGVALEIYPEGASNEIIATKAGYSASSTGYTNPRSSLKTLNLIIYPQPGFVRAADWLFP